MGVDALDPIEPPPHGDMELSEVRRQVGEDTVLFGNLEVADIEHLPSTQFEKVVAKALQEGTSGEGRGFVLLPTAALYGRLITKQAMQNYETAVEALVDRDAEQRKRALYRAGVLATGLEDYEAAQKHLSALAGIDFGYRDVAARLDKMASIRDST